MLPHAVELDIVWSELAKLLGITCRSRALPCSTLCPFCKKGRLSIYQNSTSAGPWHHCAQCHRHGDLIELAASIWGVTPEVAIKKLKEHGFVAADDEQTIEHYLKNKLQRRRRITGIFEHARIYLAQRQSPSISAMLHRYHLRSALTGKRWMDGPGRLFGALPANELLARYHNKITSGIHAACSRRLFFSGPGWEDILIFPYYLAPEQLAGYIFHGINPKTGQEHQLYRPLGKKISTLVKETTEEAGLFGLNTLQERSIFNKYVFAIDSPTAVLRLQLRHAATTTVPLPIVAWYDQDNMRTQKAWMAIGERTLIFWGFTLTASMVWQAMTHNGQIAIPPLQEVTQFNINHCFYMRSPQDNMKLAIKYAIPWRDAVGNWIHRFGRGAAEQLLFGIEKYGINPELFARDVGHGIEEFVEKPLHRYIILAPWQVTEIRGTWRAEHTDKRRAKIKLLTNALLRIDRIITGENPSYQGRIIYREAEIPFLVDAAILEDRPGAFLITQCLKAGLGRPEIATPQPDLSLVEIALRFQEATVIAPVDGGTPDKLLRWNTLDSHQQAPGTI